MIDTDQIRKDIIEAGKRLWTRSMIAANDGNISVKIDEERILSTTAGVSKGFMIEDNIVLLDLDGNPLEKGKKPSSEILMHLEIYRRRSEIKAVVHAHPPIATGFAAAGIQLDKSILPEVILTLGNVILTPYGTTGTDELAKIAGEGIKNHNGLLLQNHGAVTVGTDLWQAYYRMETLEHFARITLITKILGRQSILSEEEISKLSSLGTAKECTFPPASEAGHDKKSDKFLISRDELVNLIHKVLKEFDNKEE
jgi:L-fuculose-phosphate aldolase